MQPKFASKRTPLIAVLAGFIALSPAFLIYFAPKVFNLPTVGLIHGRGVLVVEDVATPTLTQEQEIMSVPTGEPVHLKIPKINVDSAVEYVGLAPDGAMDVPKERANVAWFDLGPNPGNSGSAVIAGHYGRKDGKGSAFDNLHKLRKGDRLYIEDDKGVIVSFVVQGSRRYDSNADASGVFSSNDGKSHLNLVTCEGVWDESTQQYSRRLVVFTDREE